MDKVLAFLKDNVKASVTVVVLGLGLTVGWAKGCTVDVKTEAPAAQVAAPAAP